MLNCISEGKTALCSYTDHCVSLQTVKVYGLHQLRFDKRLRAALRDRDSSGVPGQTVLPIRMHPGILPTSTAVPTAQQQQQQQYHTSTVLPTSHWQQQQQQQVTNSATTVTTAAAAAAAPTVPAPTTVGLLAGIAALREQRLLHIHLPFAAFFGYLGLMAATASSSDWYLDVSCFGAVWAALWAICCKWHPSARTVVLLNLLPLLHLSGAAGSYHWELGNLSWDILVHISNGFIGTLLFAAVLADVATSTTVSTTTTTTSSSSSSSSSSGGSSRFAANLKPAHHRSWKSTAWQLVQVSVLLVVGTSLIEVVEDLGGQVAGSGEGMFLRGPGDFCTVSLPCSEETDTAKDMVDNVAGMSMALIALATTAAGTNKNARP